jgi:hypothetical protein
MTYSNSPPGTKSTSTPVMLEPPLAAPRYLMRGIDHPISLVVPVFWFPFVAIPNIKGRFCRSIMDSSILIELTELESGYRSSSQQRSSSSFPSIFKKATIRVGSLVLSHRCRGSFSHCLARLRTNSQSR